MFPAPYTNTTNPFFSHIASLNRYALRDYTFHDGTFIPKGAFVTASMWSLHMDDKNYEDARTFNPWRFVEKRESGEEGESVKHQFTNTSVEYLSFGLGRHAWCASFRLSSLHEFRRSSREICSPGRFFAANEIKAMMCCLVQNYDMRLPEGVTKRPDNQYFGTSVSPDRKAEVLFRQRKRN